MKGLMGYAIVSSAMRFEQNLMHIQKSFRRLKVKHKNIKHKKNQSLPLVFNVKISIKKIIKNLIEIMLYAMTWYALTNENLNIYFDIVCYGMGL